ncbi:DNA-binding protein [Pseudomonas sp. R5(2019)]|uniref:DNA-binding protein n=1 Tax=Pseudomonas sp. R5(2019) TaxID=2697566 RepID=UPI0014129EBD|nr:DNA-binding protein [Pseudomonas sp. R5(2019)]NBA95191.1 hypothetical protein [Pseudomonas sp. R5(2019)]
MNLNPMGITQTRARLVQTPDWDKMSAYTRTLVCCRELTRCGYALPGWNVLREIIEKGSAGDISRGKTDYQAELATQVSHAEAESVGLNLDLPTSISALFEQLWHKAVKEAGLAFGIRKAEIERELEANQVVMENERANAQQAMEQSNRLSLEIHTLKQQLQDALRQCTVLQAEKDQTEKLVSEGHEAVRFQTERADLIHANAQKEIKDAVERLEGVENHCLREIERARVEAKALVDEGTAASTRTIESLKKRIDDLKQQNALLSENATESRINADFYRSRYQELHDSATAQQATRQDNGIKSTLKTIRANRDIRKQRTVHAAPAPLKSTTKKKP